MAGYIVLVSCILYVMSVVTTQTVNCPGPLIEGEPCDTTVKDECPDDYFCYKSGFCCTFRASCPQFSPPAPGVTCSPKQPPNQCRKDRQCGRTGRCCTGPCGQRFCVRSRTPTCTYD